MTNQYLISMFHEPIIAAASTSTGNTILVAGIFTIIGATIPLIYQAIYIHNQNRRDDRWSGVEAVADLIAAAHGVLLARSTSTAPNDAFSRFDSACARLELIFPGLAQQLEDLQKELLSAVNSKTRDISLEQRIEQHLKDVLNDARPQLTPPVFKFINHSKNSARASRIK